MASASLVSVNADCLTVTPLALIIYIMGDKWKPFQNYRFGLEEISDNQIVLELEPLRDTKVLIHGKRSLALPKNGKYSSLRFELPKKSKLIPCQLEPCTLKLGRVKWLVTRPK